ncbi:MAG: DUF2156 domain-containing protein [Bacteroidia bacterium]|nr:DUF2156 domain-containing protein [Bacteroidia bacterium]
MLEFKKIELSDKEWIDRVLSLSDYRGTEYCFTNLFIWDGTYNSRVGRFKDFLLLRAGTPGERYYLYPAGRGDRREVIEELMEDASREDGNLTLIGLTRETKAELEKLFPHMFKFKMERDSFDYVYDTDKLMTLSGKKLQPKRNHLNYFIGNYSWKIEDFTPDKVDEVVEFSHEWCRRYECNKIDTLAMESCAVEKCLKNYGGLDLKGAILRVDGEIIGYTIGEVLNSDTVIVHVEKAFQDYRGAYQFINREFVKKIAPGYKYVNREDDIGDEGLRKAKESYYPIFMLEKFTATLI